VIVLVFFFGGGGGGGGAIDFVLTHMIFYFYFTELHVFSVILCSSDDNF
jgi:hypothetical protein